MFIQNNQYTRECTIKSLIYTNLTMVIFSQIPLKVLGSIEAYDYGCISFRFCQVYAALFRYNTCYKKEGERFQRMLSNAICKFDYQQVINMVA